MQLSKCDIFRIKSQTQQPKKKKIVKNCFLKHSKMGWMMMMLIKNICIYTGGARISCGIFTSKPPATPTFIFPPPFHLLTIKYLDQHVKIGNVFLCISPFFFFDLFKLFVFFTRRTHGPFFFENESITNWHVRWRHT